MLSEGQIRRIGLWDKRQIAIREVHSGVKYDKNKFWEEKANDLEEAERRGQSHGLLTATNISKARVIGTLTAVHEYNTKTEL